MGQRTFSVKQGIFGRRKTRTEYFCDGCQKTFDGVGRVFSAGGNVYCNGCVIGAAPDASHDWPEPGLFSEFFIDTKTGDDVCVQSCSACCSLVRTRRTTSGLERRFLHVGSKAMHTQPVGCRPHSGYDHAGNVRSQQNCRHDFVEVATSKDLSDAAHEKHRHLMSHRNQEIEQMYGVDDVDIQYWAYGATHFWCSRCGLHYKLNPQREHLLPKIGIIGKSRA